TRVLLRLTPGPPLSEPWRATIPLSATTAIAAAAEPARRGPASKASIRVRVRCTLNEIDGCSRGSARSPSVIPAMLCPNARQSGQRERFLSKSTCSNSESSESSRNESCWQARAQSAGKIGRIRIQPLDDGACAVVSIGKSLRQRLRESNVYVEPGKPECRQDHRDQGRRPRRVLSR